MDTDSMFPQLDPEEFARVWQRVAPGQNSPVESVCVPVRNRPETSGRPNDPPAPPRPERPNRPAPPPPRPQRPPSPPLGEGCRDCEEFLRSMIRQELRRWRSIQRQNLPARLANQAFSRARRLAAVLFLISGRWYFPQQGGSERWPNRRAALRALFRESQQLEQDYRSKARETRDPVLRQLFLELANECRSEQHQIRRLLEQ